MAKFNLDEYEPVDVRIKAFYADHPDGRITTELVTTDDIRDLAIFKAYVWDNEILKATGYAMELKEDGYVNKTSHVENCETSAIGRGLANLGYSGSKRASREEMEKVERVTASDSERIQHGKEEIYQLLEDNKALLIPEYFRAMADNAESAKTLEDVKSVYRDLKKAIAEETRKEQKDRQREELAAVNNKSIPESLQRAIDEKAAQKELIPNA